MANALVKSFKFDNTTTFDLEVVVSTESKKELLKQKVEKASSLNIDLTKYGLSNDEIVTITATAGAKYIFKPGKATLIYHAVGKGDNKMVVAASSPHQTSNIIVSVIDRDDCNGYSKVCLINHAAVVVKFIIKNSTLNEIASGTKSVGYNLETTLTDHDPSLLHDGDSFYISGDVKAGSDPGARGFTYSKYSGRTLTAELKGTTVKTWFNIK